MTTGNKVTPTSTVLQSRIIIYQPSQRPIELKGEWMKTAFGRCRVIGRLGQRHADIVESMLYVAERKREVSDGGIELLVDPARLRRTLSDCQYSLGRIQKLIGDLRAAIVEIITPDLEGTGNSIIGGIIDHVIPSGMMRPNPLTGRNRKLWRVRLGVALAMLLKRDLRLYYSPEPIARLQHGISQAVARHILTHKHVPVNGWHMDTLIQAVTGKELSNQTKRDGRRRMKQDAKQLGELGIEIDLENRVKRSTAARQCGAAAR